MCDPLSIMAGVTAFTAISGAKASHDQGQFKKGTANYNARVAQNEAQQVRNQSVEAENDHRTKVAQILSRQRAQLAANNIDLNSGSALGLQEDTVTLGEADALRIRSNYDGKVNSLLTQSDLTKAQGRFASTAGNNQAIGSLLSGASSILDSGVADKWFTPQSAANTANTAVNLNGSSSLKYIETVV